MRIMKITILVLLFSTSVFAADKPAWVIEAKTLDLPQYEYYGKNERPNYDPKFKIQFSPKDEIMLSFFQRSKKPVLTIKDSHEMSGLSFVTLFLSKEDGKLINKAGWLAAGELDWWERAGYGSRIYPLPDNGYVGIFNKRLQVLNSSLDVIYDRLLERLPQGYVYGINAPSHGTFFALEQSDKSLTGPYDIIDCETFKTVARVNGGIVDIWKDKLLIRSYMGSKITHLFERRIGSSSEDFHVKIDNFEDAKFAHNGSAIVLSYRGQFPPFAQYYWFTIENGKTGDPVFVEGEYVNRLVVARTGLVFAVSASKSRLFDRGASGKINVYDINTQQMLLQTQTYNDAYDYALSSDGLSLAVFLREKRKIEIYKIPASVAKKK